MILKKLGLDFTVCKLPDAKEIDFNQDFIFYSKTDEEISFVCASHLIPKNTIDIEPGWKALRIEGILDFGMIGVIAKIARLLADAEISIFVISTYNTDYIFIQSHDFEKSIALLKDMGYEVV